MPQCRAPAVARTYQRSSASPNAGASPEAGRSPSARQADRLDALHRAAAFPGAQWGTLLYLCQPGPHSQQVLLMRKQRGHGAGFVNAPGGKTEPGETPLACVLRETNEELCLQPLDARLLGELRFQDVSGDRVWGWVYQASCARGVATATAEADPFWCSTDSIPYDDMWPGDRYWLPSLLAGQAFRTSLLVRGTEVLAVRHSVLNRAADAEPGPCSGNPSPTSTSTER